MPTNRAVIRPVDASLTPDASQQAQTATTAAKPADASFAATLQKESAKAPAAANRVVPPGEALAAAKQLAHGLARLPQAALRSDRLSAIEQWGLGWDQAVVNEFRLGIATVESGESEAGARRFAAGAGRHGATAPE